MRLWFDAHLSPAVAQWVSEAFAVPCFALRDLGLHDANDTTIFEAAYAADAIVVTKDSDFAQLSAARGGPPPAVLWLTFGNTSNAALKARFQARLAEALALFQGGARLVELR